MVIRLDNFSGHKKTSGDTLCTIFVNRINKITLNLLKHCLNVLICRMHFPVVIVVREHIIGQLIVRVV